MAAATVKLILPPHAALIEPPRAEKRPKTLQDPHGQQRQDPYYWLRDDDREDPAMLAHLEAENAYTKAVLSDTEQLQKDLTKELRARIQEADESAPLRQGRAESRDSEQSVAS